MPFDVAVNQNNLPEGAEVFIYGLGTFPNQQTTRVDDEQVDLWRNMNAKVVDKYDDEGRPIQGVYDRELPDILEVDILGVEVTKVSDSKKDLTVEEHLEADLKEAGEG